MKRGDYAIVCDPDVRDIYIAECLEKTENPTIRNILVCVRYMIQYPIQHAIIHRDTARENRPIRPETPCYLRYVREANESDVAMANDVGYEHSLQKALADELERVKNRIAFAQAHPTSQGARVDPEELMILARHARGEFRGTRSIMIKKAAGISWL